MSERRYVGIDEIATHLGTSVRHVRSLVARKQIPHTKLGGKLRFDLRRIDEWMRSNEEVAS